MSKKCKAYSRSGLGLELPDSRKAFYAGWDAARAQQQEPWVELTDEQVDEIVEQVEDVLGVTNRTWDILDPRDIVRAIIKAAHLIKKNNT